MSQPVVIALHGELGLEQAPVLRERLLDAISTTATVLVLDMSAVTFIDSTGVGVLIAAHKRLTSDERELRFAAIQEPVSRTLGIMGLHRLLLCYPTVAAARRGGPGS